MLTVLLYFSDECRHLHLTIVPFLDDLFLELIESVQRSSALESKSLCLEGVGRSVKLHNRKTLELILPMTEPLSGPCGNDMAVNTCQSMASIQPAAGGLPQLSHVT